MKNFNYGTKKATHRIAVRSLVSSESDNKTFSISVHDGRSTFDLSKILEKYFEIVLNEKFEKETKFTSENNGQKKKSHVIVVVEIDKNNSNKNKTKSFTVCHHSYSSTEIAKELSLLLCGDKDYVE